MGRASRAKKERKQNAVDGDQVVAYNIEKKVLIATISDETAEKMTADGWTVEYDADVGHFISVKLEE